MRAGTWMLIFNSLFQLFKEGQPQALCRLPLHDERKLTDFSVLLGQREELWVTFISIIETVPFKCMKIALATVSSRSGSRPPYTFDLLTWNPNGTKRDSIKLSGEKAKKGLLLKTGDQTPTEARSLESQKEYPGCAFFIGYGEGDLCGVIALRPPDVNSESGLGWWCLKFAKNLVKDKKYPQFCFTRLTECNQAIHGTLAGNEEDQLDTNCGE